MTINGWKRDEFGFWRSKDGRFMVSRSASNNKKWELWESRPPVVNGRISRFANFHGDYFCTLRQAIETTESIISATIKDKE